MVVMKLRSWQSEFAHRPYNSKQNKRTAMADRADYRKLTYHGTDAAYALPNEYRAQVHVLIKC